MISVGNRDGRKGLGLGLGFGGGGGGSGKRQMEESELEEGEACSFQNHEDYDASIDPDVVLSYIDEKIQDVLGHFQKDFEGGVSRENLGAKFGGYGSFLPTYQRSPVWSQARTPPKVHSQNTPRSPDNLQLEGGQGDTVQFSTGAQSLRLGPGSAGSSRPSAVKVPSVDDRITQEKCMTITDAEAFTSKNTDCTSMSDQKTLKVRIKMGSDNLSTRKNAAIYSGLGLDVSPSSSLDDSPSESEGISREPQDAPFESPDRILQIMTVLPKLLSPLPDDLIQLTEKETRAGESIPVPDHMDGPESSGMLLHESNILRGDINFSGGKKMKSLEGYGSSMEVKGCTKKNTQNDVGVLSRKERGIDAFTTEDLVSKTLKLPLLSSSYSFSDDSLKAVDGTCDALKEANKGIVREKTFSDQAQKGLLEPTFTEVNGFIERVKESSGRKAVGDKVSLEDLSGYTGKDNPNGDKICDSTIAECNVSNVATASNPECREPPRKAYQKGSLCKQDSMTLLAVKENPFPGGKKSKGSHGTMTTERGKENLKVGTPLVPKIKKSSDDSSTSKKETEDVRVQRDLGKARDTYRDFFGDLEEEEDRMDSPETPYENKLKETEVVKTSTPTINCGAKERSGGKKVDKALTSQVYPRMASNVQYTGNLHGADADNGKGVHVSGPPAAMKDNWVQCDRCHKWRLLPVGTNPDNLPEKWLCSMLNWLPDMNRCSISEDETTKALIALYQGHPPEGQSNLQKASASVMLGGTVATAQHPDQQQLNHDLHVVTGGKKKIVKEISSSAKKDGVSQLSSSAKKNLHSSVKSKSLNDVNKSPVMSEADVLGEKHKIKQRIVERNPDRGDAKNMKMKKRKDPGQDCSRSSKKGKIDGIHSTDETRIPEQSRTTRKVGDFSNSSLPTKVVGKDHSSSRDPKYDRKDRLQVSVGKTKDKGQGSLEEGSLDLGNYDSIGTVKKRKLKEYQDTQPRGSDHPNLQESRVSVQEFSDIRREKKARNLKSEGRESGASKGSGRTDKKVSYTKNLKLRQDPRRTLSQRSLDGMDLGSVQASAAATTSSSSKVSGSHKTKTSFHEVKGSPVESVSSSPMRVLNTDKFTNRELMGKDDSHYTAALGSPRRCSDGEDHGGIDRSGTVRKDKSYTMAHHRSHGSSMPDFQNKGVNHVSDSKSKAQTLPSPGTTTSHFTNGVVDTIGQDGTYPATEHIKDQCQGEDRTGVYCANVSYPRKAGKGSLLKDNSESCKSESNAEKIRNTSSPIQLQDQSPSEAKQHRDGKLKLRDKLGFKPDKSENIHAGKKVHTRNGSRTRENNLNREHDFLEVSMDAICKQEALPAPSQNQLADCDTERSSKWSLSERTDHEMLGKGKSVSLPPARGDQIETLDCCPRPFVGFHKGNGNVTVDPSKVDDLSKLQKKQIRKADHQNGTQQIVSRHPTLNGHRSDAPSPVRKDSYSHTANNALKEAKDLKHLADRLKNSGSTLESTGIYFQAALKFLHGASLLESGNNDNAKHTEMIPSKQMYSSTAKLCGFCAHEYEKSKDMAAAALAYKCMEVAYMRVIYSSHTSASRDRRELQTALQMVPLGESPSSSASDVDNVNNSTTADKVALSKSASSPQLAGNHVIAAQNRPNFVQLLDFAQDVNFAMEASRKSRNAFAAANSKSGEGKHAEGISSIKKALDFSFQDVEGLLRLVRLAMEAISR